MGEVLCEFKTKAGGYHGANPRTLARTQVQRLADMGMTIMSGCEVSSMIVTHQ